MSNHDLSSVVFVLRPPKAFLTDHFMGRAAHKLFLWMVRDLSRLTGDTSYKALSKSLHNLNASLPFTVSNLFQNGASLYWMRVTGLESSLCTVLATLVQFAPRNSKVDGWTIEAGLASHHEWTKQTKYADLVQTYWVPPSGQRLNLNFVTPTTLKSIGNYHPFPYPGLVFKLLYERLRNLKGFSLPFQPDPEHVEIFAEYFITIEDYQIQCIQVAMQETLPSFQGQISYRLLRENKAFKNSLKPQITTRENLSPAQLHDQFMGSYQQYVSLLNLLTAFAFYSGVGIKTGQGMGMVRAKHH